jgi:hypothetical protein
MNSSSCSNHHSFSALGFRTAHCFCDYSSTHEKIIKFLSPGSGLNENLIFWPVLGTHISPGGNCKEVVEGGDKGVITQG